MDKTQRNYLIQTNFFTESITKDVSEVQRDVLYYIQSKVNFYDQNPPDKIIFNFDEFLAFKNKLKNNFYSVDEVLELCSKLRTVGGAFYNKNTRKIELFNIFSNVSVSIDNPNEFDIELAKWGKIFFFEKHALAYTKSNNVAYTQIESNIINLKGDKKKKFFELLSQWKSTGIYKVSLEKLKTLLGFIVYENQSSDDPQIEQQLKFFFEEEKENQQLNKIEYLSRWSEFKRVFLDPAIDDFNTDSKLDISNIKYSTTKLGRKITGLEFTFQKRYDVNELDDVHQTALKHFVLYGLNEKQVIFLFQRIGYKEMYNRLNSSITFNRHYDNKEHTLYHKKVWFENETGTEIKNLGGYLYDKIFPELKN